MDRLRALYRERGRAGRRAGRGLTVPRRPTVRLAVWSGPRNISTALMRAWENRPDTVVVDEPLYAHYLAATGLDHPGRDEVIAAGETDWRRVVAGLAGPVPDGIRVQYQKHMAHHLLPEHRPGLGRRPDQRLLIRDPREVVASYVRARAVGDGRRHRPAPAGRAVRRPGRAPARPRWSSTPATSSVAPRPYLRALCDHAGVPFTERMLSWPAGPPATSDGVWGRHWYAAVWRSTGFGQPGPVAPTPLRPPRRGGRAVPPVLRAAPSRALGPVTAPNRPSRAATSRLPFHRRSAAAHVAVGAASPGWSRLAA